MARKISVEIVGDATSLEKAFKKSSKSASKFQGDMSKTTSKTKSAFGGLSRGALGLAGAFVGTAGLVGAARAAFGEMADAQKVTAQTNAVLKSTGKAAKVSAKHVDALASSLLNVSGVDDELIKSGENVLLTFTSIRNEAGKGNKIFDEATRAALDMSVALGKDLQGSAIQVGKALNDPVRGITALQRVGVQFTAGQRDQIKALVDSNRTLDAQKIILKELQKEFGGSAAAAGKTLPGQLNILRQTLLNLAGAIATAITPAIQKLVQQMVAWLSKSKNQKQVLDTVKAAASVLETALKALSATFKFLNAVTGSTKRTFELLLGLFVAFKALKLVRYIASMTKAMQGFAVASAEANAAGMLGGGRAGRIGKAGKLARLGRVAGVGALALGAPELAIIGGSILATGGDKRIAHMLSGGRRLRTPQDVRIYLDGREMARATARHDENERLHRSKQRAHSRRSTR
jgi:hypothetical protein